MKKLCRVLDTDIKLHWSIIIPFVISAAQLQYLVAMLLVYVFVVFHEFGHILMCRRFGNDCKTIILSALGGAAVVERNSESPFEEFSVALAGPAVNVALILLLPFKLSIFINLVIALFNMIPAYPMDGGRVLCALLWKVIGIKWANRICLHVTLLLASAGVTFGVYNSDYWFAFVSFVVGVLGVLSIGDEDEQSVQDKMDSGERSRRTASEQDHELLRVDTRANRNNGNIRWPIQKPVEANGYEGDAREAQRD